MTIFTSDREKRYWFYVLLVLFTLIFTLFFGQPLFELFERLFESQDVQAAIFLMVMFLIAATIILHGITSNPSYQELTIWVGLGAVYLMFFLRLGLAERSHLMEYSVLAIFIHKALMERFGHTPWLKPALLALVISVSIGVLDEVIQWFIPSRFFDPLDIIFNSGSAVFAISASLILEWASRKWIKSNDETVL